ncbi:hypothetical protein ACQR35_06200 [Pseudarthrobacter sp. J1738]|uniref:hypothetical protein n=1 Tax=Pseudarthrobacter sp. J1738 TaxID=3420446 RepID=UPI003D288DC7
MSTSTTTAGQQRYRMSVLAWPLALAKSATNSPTALRTETVELLSALSAEDHTTLEQELFDAGITTSDGQLSEAWQELLAQVLSANIVVDFVSRTPDASQHTQVWLFGGLAAAYTQARTVRQESDGTVEVVGLDPVADLVLFRETDLWPVLAAGLPDHPLLQAPAANAALADGPKYAIPAEDVAALQTSVHQTSVHGSTPVPAVGGLPPEVRDAVVRPKASVHVTVSTQQKQQGAVWALSEKLYSLRGPTRHGSPANHAPASHLVEVSAGDIAREVLWLVLGAHDLQASAEERSTNAAGDGAR